MGLSEMKGLILTIITLAVGLSVATECDVSTEFMCRNGDCIPSVWKCDGERDCQPPDESDETSCTAISCNEGDFQCHGDNSCIPQNWMCDNEWDCIDGSDEMNSTCSADCPASKFTCPGDIIECIPNSWVCDNDHDCGNGGDEQGCTPEPCLQDTQFQCVSDGKCIANRWVCDGDIDCNDGSDEAESVCQNNRMCPNETLECSYGVCIPIRWRCDGDIDCPNGIDEEDCNIPDMCEHDEFHCAVSGACIPGAFVCDGDGDCETGEDEEDCPVKTCSPEEFACQGGETCIPLRWVCDRDNDCDDNSDEDSEMCRHQTTSCPSNKMMCKDGNCLPSVWRCDGENDCTDGSDELNCEIDTCIPGSFICGDGSCRPAGSECNGIQDCPDDSDEIDCPVCSLPGMFQCQYEDDSCLDIAQVCDGVDNCVNGDDENECTTQPCSDDNGGCGTRMCISLPNGYYCDCGTGYEFTLHGCQDINECMQTRNPCPGTTCTNLPSNYTCSCPGNDYILDTDGHTCVYANSTPPSLLLSRSTDIILLDMLHNESSIYAAGSFRASVGISYDPVKDSVYISDVAEQNIQRVTISDADDVDIQPIINTGNADGISFDWIYRNIYWTDSDSDTISVASLDGQYKKDLINENLDEPRAIVVDPAHGYMYWSDWGEQPHIGRASLDGQLRVTLVSEDVQWVNGLALDYQLQRLYWVDGKSCRIESVNLDGSNRHVVYECSGEVNQHMFGLAVFQDTLYISDWTLQAVHSINKFTGENLKTLFRFGQTPNGLTLTQGYYEAPNLCIDAGSPCSHLCLRSIATPNGFVCACPANTTLAPDQHTCMCDNGNRLLEDGISCEDENVCQENPDSCPGLLCVNTKDGPNCLCPEHYHLQEDKTGGGSTCRFTDPTPPSILVADVQFIKGIDTQLDRLESAVGRFSSATALAYDSTPGHQAIYASDNIAGTITRIEYINKEEGNRTVIVSNGGSFFGLAFDYIGRYLYWSDSQQGTISVTSWDGGYTKELVNRTTGTGILRALVVDPETGYMYWTDIRPRYASIWRAALDGSNAEQIVTSSLLRPVSLALLSSENSLYWVDAGLKQIEMAKTDGSNRRVLLKKGLRRPFGIAVYQDTVFWTDAGKSALLSANRFSGGNLRIEIENLKRPMGLAVAVEAERTGVPYSCDSEGIICSHFCLGTPKAVNQQGFTCACPGNNTMLSGDSLSVCVCLNGSHLDTDGITCKKPGGDCQRDEFHCQKDGKCIPLQDTCNGNIDCTDGSDEECQNGCGNWGYQCSSGSCIPLYLRCDGVPGDCLGDDYEDELNCEISEELDWCNVVDPIPCPGIQCLNLLNGPQCVCPMGYILDSDARTCLFSIPSSPQVLVATNGDIILVDTLHGSTRSVDGDWPAVLSVVYDFDSGFMFVYDRLKNTMERFTTTGGFFGDLSVSDGIVLSSSLNVSEGLAYDWIHRNVYLVNIDEGNIGVQPFDGRYPLSVVIRNLDKPRAIAVDPNERFMYWTDWGADAMIGKAGLDGSNPSQLVNTEIVWPNGLALDYQARRVYWVDSRMDRMEYIGFDGDGRKVLIQHHSATIHPFDIAIHQDKVIWGDWRTETLFTANKFTGELLNNTTLGLSPMFISVIREYLPYFEAINYCSGQNGCSHLCLPSPSSPTNYTCACPHEAYLDSTNKTCLCNDEKPLPRDGSSCQVEADDHVTSPLEVHGVTTLFLAEQTDGKFELQCTIEENGIMCLPKGGENADKWTSKDEIMPWSCKMEP